MGPSAEELGVQSVSFSFVAAWDDVGTDLLPGTSEGTRLQTPVIKRPFREPFPNVCG
jgi:hypothetical protein